MDAEATLPPHRRSDDSRIDQIERGLAENTKLTSELKESVAALDTKFSPLLQMKTDFDAHLAVLCTWGKWARRGFWSLLTLAGAVLPVVVAAKQLGWL